MVGLAPRAPGDSVRPRRLADVVVRPLNFTVRCRVLALSRLVCLVLSTSVVGCATPKPMDLCDPDARPTIPHAILTRALSGAQAYSDQIYGRDCVVCAEVFAQTPNSFMLHITSPSFPDMVLNTSAEVTVNSSDGSIISRGQAHSCYVHRTHGGGP